MCFYIFKHSIHHISIYISPLITSSALSQYIYLIYTRICWVYLSSHIIMFSYCYKESVRISIFNFFSRSYY